MSLDAPAPRRGRAISRAVGGVNGAMVAIVTFAALCLLSAIGAGLRDERSLEVQSVKFEPPRIAALRLLAWKSSVSDSANVASTGPEAIFDLASSGTLPPRPYFTSSPSTVARLGDRYEYQPTSPFKLRAFNADMLPPGIAIDDATGTLSGKPTERGKWEVKLSASGDSGLTVVQKFDLFVDDRTLWLGADESGRDFLRRLLQSLQFILLPGVIAALVSVGGGLLTGAYAGYVGGRAESALNMFTVVMRGIPALLAVIFAVKLYGDMSVPLTMSVVGLALLPETADGIRSRVRAFRAKDFVDASRELGMTDREILWREIIWHNCRVFLLSRISQAFIYALLVDVTISYLHLVDPNSARLGVLLLDAKPPTTPFEMAPLLFIAPLLVLLSIIGAFQLIERSLTVYWGERR